MNILIVEDELRIAKLLSRMILEIWEEPKPHIQHFPFLDQAKSYLEEHSIDLLFLDLNLRGEDGFELLESVSSEAFLTVIVSAYREEAIRAFEYGVLDFIPKPFSRDRIQKTYERLKKRRASSDHAPRVLPIKKQGKLLFIELANVLYFKSEGHFARIILQSGKKEVCDKSLEKLEILLDQDFIRVHRSYIVKKKSIKHIRSSPGSKYQLQLEDGSILPLARSRVNFVKEELSK